MLLQDAQQFDLGIRRQLAHFIEKNGAAVGQGKATIAICQRARECAFRMTEEFALDEARADRSAVDFHQWTPVDVGSDHEWRGR